MLICAFATACAADHEKFGHNLSLQVPQDCEQLAQTVDEPEWIKGMKAKVLLATTTAALQEANGNLEATQACQAKQRETLARGGRPE